MKKHFYPIIGCVTLLAIGTAYAGDAVAAAVDAVATTLAAGDHNADAYLKPGSPVDLEAKFNVATGAVDVSFNAPATAWWSDDYDYISDEEKESSTLDAVRVYRNEGFYISASEAVLVKEFNNVEWHAFLEFSDDSSMAHGKRYCYWAVAEYKGHQGEKEYSSVEVGYRIDPATDFSVRGGERGALQATVTFTAPTTCNDGAYTIPADQTIPLIEIGRKIDYWAYDYAVITSFADVEPGAELTFTDTHEALAAGESYVYRLTITYDGSKVSDYTNSASVFMGNDSPKGPSSLTAALNADDDIMLSWDAPTEGLNGAWFDPELLTYKVERGNGTSTYNLVWTTLADGITATTYTDNAVSEEGSYYYRVTSQIEGKDGGNTVTATPVVAGPPTPFPFYESWAGAKAEHSTWAADDKWQVYGSTSISYYDAANRYSSFTLNPADGDGGMMLLNPGYSAEAGDVFSLTSGRISLKDAVNPVVWFNYFDFVPEAGDNALKVLVSADGGEFVEQTVNFASLPHDNSWTEVMVSLADYVEEAAYIQVRFQAIVGENGGKSAIDNVQIRDARQVDLAVKRIKAPAKFYPGTRMNVTLEIDNLGDYAAEPFAAMLYLGDAELGYSECEGLAAHSSTTMNVEVTIPETDFDGTTTITATLIGGYDEDEENNTNAIEAELVALPAPSDLAYNADDACLTWTAADDLPFSDGAVNVKDDFSEYEECTNVAPGNWTVIDGDVGGTFSLPGVNGAYPLENKATGGFVFVPSNHNSDWDTPTAGGACFVFPGAYSAANDWLISPELTGEAQTVTYLVATRLDGGYVSESYEFCASSTDTNPASFTVLESESFYTSAEWETRSVALPAGTKYFAIHYNKSYGDMLAFTDFTFTTGSGLLSDPTELVGYNLYRDDEKVNDEPLTGTSYQFPLGHASSGSYAVKAAYNNAESQASEPVEVIVSGVSSAVADAAGVTVNGSELVIADGVEYSVADINGRIVARGVGAARLTPAAGAYIVTANGLTFKILTK